MIRDSISPQKSVSMSRMKGKREGDERGGRTREGFDALTASLWRQRFGGEVKYMQRIGILNSLAISIQ